MKLTSVDIAGSDSNDCGWLSQLDFKDGAVTIRDYRTGETGYERRKMTDADRAMYVFPVPDFGDVETLWQRVSLHLAAEGLKGFA